MKYGDEALIAARVASLAKEEHTINNEITISGEYYTFTEHVFINTFCMMVPHQFIEFPVERAKIKYPMENRPPIILSNEDGTVNINLSYEKSDNTSIEERIRNYSNAIKKLSPSNLFFLKSVIKCNNVKIGYYDFRSPSLGEDIYNIHVIFDIGEMEMFLGFNCPVSVQKQWKPLMLEMIETIKKIEEEAYPCANAP